MTEEGIINRVSGSSLQTFDLELYYQPGKRVELDISSQLFQGLIIKEKDFRNFVKEENWSIYKDHFVAIYCSTDAIIPTWAYMLLTVALEPFAKRIVFGRLSDLENILYQDALAKVDWSQFKDAKIVLKGCSKVDVPVSAYVEATQRLRAVAASLMFGEPCSTVPIFKRQKAV
jgi:hypothetical protein